MTYAEKMTMKLMGEMSYNYGNQPETLKIIKQIIADTKAACKRAIEPKLIYADNKHCEKAIDQIEVGEQ